MTEVKKRGRKAKDPTCVDTDKNTENVPKKRGRKPVEKSYNKILVKQSKLKLHLILYYISSALFRI